MDPTLEAAPLPQAAIPTPHNSSNNLALRLDHMAHHKEAQPRRDLIHRTVQLELRLQDRTLHCRLIQQRRVDTVRPHKVDIHKVEEVTLPLHLKHLHLGAIHRNLPHKLAAVILVHHRQDQEVTLRLLQLRQDLLDTPKLQLSPEVLLIIPRLKDSTFQGLLLPKGDLPLPSPTAIHLLHSLHLHQRQILVEPLALLRRDLRAHHQVQAILCILNNQPMARQRPNLLLLIPKYLLSLKPPQSQLQDQHLHSSNNSDHLVVHPLEHLHSTLLTLQRLRLNLVQPTLHLRNDRGLQDLHNLHTPRRWVNPSNI